MPGLMLLASNNGSGRIAPERADLRQDMSRDTFASILEWIMREPPEEEPGICFVDPRWDDEFAWMAKRARDSSIKASVLTNTATNDALASAEQLKGLGVEWRIDVTRASRGQGFLEQLLPVLGNDALLVIELPAQQIAREWLADMICEYGLRRKLAVALHSALSGKHEHLSEKDYSAVAETVLELARFSSRFDISLEYGCGIPWCMFTSEQLGELWRLNSEFFSQCDSDLIVTHDGQISYCPLLCDFCTKTYADYPSYHKAKEWFERHLANYRLLGTTCECISCDLNSLGPCRGGCLGQALATAKNL